MSNENELYTDAGFRVMRLQDATKNSDGELQCECGNPECKAIRKHPFASNWQNTPKWSSEQLDTMREFGWLDNFGVILDKHFVIDIDPRNGGMDSYIALKEALGIEFDTISGLVVETGGSGLHIYFNNSSGKALKTHSDDYPGIDFKSSGFVVGAGSIHASGNYYKIESGDPDSLTEIPDALISLLEKKHHHRATVSGQAIDITDQELTELVSFISPEEYDDWITVGMGIHHATGGLGEAIFDTWSQGSEKYDSDESFKKWHSFGKSANPVTLGTIYHMAETAGYVQPVTFEMPGELVHTETKEESKPSQETEQAKTVKSQHYDEAPSEPCDTSAIDLLRPPGMTGEIVAHLNDNVRRKREWLTVMGALSLIGNIGGLRYTDTYSATTNAFWLGIADSGTGKDGVINQCAEVYKRLSLATAVMGTIKSEQEIVRNLIENQANFYVIDEFGKYLQKLHNASEKGGAPYLEGVIGILMNIYSKANSDFLVSGDIKRTLRADLLKEIERYNSDIKKTNKIIKEHEYEDAKDKARLQHFIETSEKKIKSLKIMLEESKTGIKKPFLSMTGFSTSTGFSDFFTKSTVSDGFLGRSLLFIENDSAPRLLKIKKVHPLPDHLIGALYSIYSGQSFNNSYNDDRIELKTDRTVIPTDSGASELLNKICDYFDDLSVHYQGTNGYEALSNRAFESVLKISLILALPERLRRIEHVEYAFKLVKRDIDSKIRMVENNEKSDSKLNVDKISVLATRVLSVTDGTEMPLSVIVQRCKTKAFTKEDVIKMVEHLEGKGIIIKKVSIHPKNGRESFKYIKKDK